MLAEWTEASPGGPGPTCWVPWFWVHPDQPSLHLAQTLGPCISSRLWMPQSCPPGCPSCPRQSKALEPGAAQPLPLLEDRTTAMAPVWHRRRLSRQAGSLGSARCNHSMARGELQAWMGPPRLGQGRAVSYSPRSLHSLKLLPAFPSPSLVTSGLASLGHRANSSWWGAAPSQGLACPACHRQLCLESRIASGRDRAT